MSASAEGPLGFDPGEPVAIAAGIRRVVAPNAGRMTGPGTNTYLIGSTEVVILDPGPALELHVEAIVRAVGSARVAAIAVTHTHRDHSPAAAALKAHFGAPLVGRVARYADFQDPSFVPDAIPGDGATWLTDAGVLVAVPTPGHASNHVCWWMPQEGWLFTGDHILGTVSPVILAPDGDMAEYLDSLGRLARLPLTRIAPGHGPVLDDPQSVIASLVRHRLAREAAVLAALAALAALRPVSIDVLLPAVYRDVDPSMHDFARYSLEAHLLKLERERRIRREGSCWGLP